MPRARRFLFLSRSAITTALAIAFTLLTGTALLTAFSTRGMVLSNRKTLDAERTLIAATQAFTSLDDVETGARACVLAPGDDRREAYEAALARLRDHLATLRHAFAARPEAAHLLNDLQRLAQAKLAELDHAAQLILSLDLPAEGNPARRDEGRPILEPASDT